ncbi:ABC transporter substrate-binding protein [Flavilitoribacter nigricans]|uniref:ABC transporter substrate-binding protein n=1 Tax=Flavilitoribacter nigricans (strain ATCC 23147 / DSM 23189 / NBRC 102662 / NCIMB 1420 / SS-2) TaxID=1122177 RepID=A0A2D0N5C3_FLAN2|nr:ABC transporter substrate-binding protein [Flavilitoribacter nigricans]PHN02973.1 ABC transporter substrate-binding protein [Flavilitoribacter nigricans DSM 23189 = NBRC 102662]
MRFNHHHHVPRGRLFQPFLILPLLLVSLFLSNCSEKSTTELNFAFGPDDSGAVADLIEAFNQTYKGEIQVNWQEGSRVSNEFYREIEKDQSSDNPSMDIIGADVVWTAALAHAGWARDLSNNFYDNYQTNDFNEASLNSTIYQSKIWGMPWYMDAGILYYRKDLLAANGFDHPPVTWSELKQMAKTIMANDGPKYGYVFQGANYEGGVVNACEFIWNAGGNFLISDLSIGSEIDESSDEVNIITINSDAAKMGLTEALDMITSGVSPEVVSNFKERETAAAFANGDAIFMRAWPTAYPALEAGDTKVTTDQFALAPLPVSEFGMQSYSCLGGWNLVISNHIDADKEEAAWKFIQFMTDARQQKELALNGGTLPTLQQLYSDERLMRKAPVVDFARQVIQNTRVRPITSKYMELSPDIAWTFNEVLKGNLNPTEAVETMQGQMEDVLAAN